MNPAGDVRWSVQRVSEWYRAMPLPLGANFIPSNAVNQLEMWQPETWSPALIDRELGFATALGMNTARVFLHDLPWVADPGGFLERIDHFLGIAARHGIRPLLVLFDSCWNPGPHGGPQPAPLPGVHNSRWVQSPGARLLADRSAWPRLERYVRSIVGSFPNDDRILAWDLWNEPDNGSNNFETKDPPDKIDLVNDLLPLIFQWARKAGATHPLTSGVWMGQWSPAEDKSETNRLQLSLSDFLTFHNYGPPSEFERRILDLEPYGRPIVCTEYLARPLGSTFSGILPLANKHGVGMMNWGLVTGKTQTNLPWDSWAHPYRTDAPAPWFHDLLYPDGRPYEDHEVEAIRDFTR